MAAAVAAAIVLTVLMPDEVRLGPNWLLPVVEGVLLIALIVADPGRIYSPLEVPPDALRSSLVLILVLSALWATGALIDDLIHGGPETNSASDLLEAGSIVWVSNNIAFALLYWDLDGGGAAARALDSPRRIDLAFPQEINPGLASPVGALASSTTSTSVSRTRRHSARRTSCRWRRGPRSQWHCRRSSRSPSSAS